jgi:hypothetical protein
MIDANTNIAVTLNAQQWNTLLVQLAEGPYRLVAPLLTAIQQQCQEYDAEPPSMMMPRRTAGGANGADPHTDP